jgi:ParB family chromosome partitioning protein
MSKKNKEQLGKGLRALLGNIEKVDSNQATEVKQEVIKELSKGVAEISISEIEPNPFQPRTDFDQDELLELVQSIKTHGIIQPITVRSLAINKYQLISGERRWRASKLAGLKDIPAYIRLADDQGMLEMAIVENIQRSNLNALEVAISYQRLLDECNLQHEELADRVGKERSTVTNYMRLLKLPPDIQSGLKNEQISMGHARALLSVDNITDQLFLYKKVIRESLSVRNTEKLIRERKSNKPSSGTKSKAEIHPEVRKIKNRLSTNFGTKVDISRSKDGKGKIVIHFNSDDQFNDIIDSIED